MFLPNINMQNLLGDIAVNFSFQLHYRDPLHLISWVLISALRHTSNKHLFPLIWTTRNMEPRLSVFRVVILSTHYLRAWRVKTFLSSAVYIYVDIYSVLSCHADCDPETRAAAASAACVTCSTAADLVLT